MKQGVTIETTDTYSTLTVKGVTGDQSGVYRVKAKNIVDEVFAEFTVYVKGGFIDFCIYKLKMSSKHSHMSHQAIKRVKSK